MRGDECVRESDGEAGEEVRDGAKAPLDVYFFLVYHALRRSNLNVAHTISFALPQPT